MFAEQALDPPFTAMQMQRYIRFARRLNPTITTEGKRTMVDCYRALRENDSVGRNKVWVCVLFFVLFCSWVLLRVLVLCFAFCFVFWFGFGVSFCFAYVLL